MKRSMLQQLSRVVSGLILSGPAGPASESCFGTRVYRGIQGLYGENIGKMEKTL